VDETRDCPICGTEFTVPSYVRKIYCSIPCAAEGRKGRTNPAKRQIEKRCPICDKSFWVPPSQARVICCSRACAAARKRGGNLQEVRQMSEGEAMWFAGLFDGEGSVVLSQRKRKDNEYLVILVTNTSLPLLDRLHEVVGVGSITFNPKSEKNPRHQDIYTWRVGGEQAKEILRQARPWLIVKAERTDAVLAGESFPRQSRWDHIYPRIVP
jgi:hypothetical protein